MACSCVGLGVGGADPPVPGTLCPGAVGLGPGHHGAREVGEAAVHFQVLEVVGVLSINGGEGAQVDVVAQSVQVDLGGGAAEAGVETYVSTWLLLGPWPASQQEATLAAHEGSQQ